MVRKILVATDGSDHARKALRYACDLGEKFGATVHLVHVIMPLPGMGGGELVGQIEEIQENNAKEIIAEAKKEFEKRGFTEIHVSTLHGDPAQEIIRFAQKNDIDMIFLGSRGAGKLESLFLGSVSHKVCNAAHCTCVTVK
jgi:nucleotide-binding universal stress UspA family protein